jgi:uncharacterized 2Fe-2S/4Fe-4S cluster protein (DUF4445 family)
MEHEVVFNPAGRGGAIEEGKTLHEAATELGIEIESLCGGEQKCGKCKVVVDAGQENLSPMEEPEKKLLTKEEIETGYRLSCEAKVKGPVSVTIPPESSGGEMVILESSEGFAVEVLPDPVDESFGIAFDIGTTTVVGYLMNLKSGDVLSIGSIMNPQTAYGEDVMSRIAYTTKNSGGLEILNKIIIDALNKIIKNASAKAGIKPRDISRVTAVGNTAMHHIFLNLDPGPLGVSPFSPVITGPVDKKAGELGLATNEGATLHMLPNVAGFVGADNIGVLIASEPYRETGVTLTIDVGTNGEIVLSRGEEMFAASCATGPALEGAHIRHGMRAKPGAIEHMKIDGRTMEVTCKVIGNIKPTGICGSGVVDAVAELLKAGILQKNGKFNLDIKTERLRKGEEGYEFVIAGDIVITQKDISEVQLAKGALYAGAKILMKRAGADSVDRIFLAGAFGSHIDPESALAIGMLPEVPVENIKAIGNAAGEGARIALLSAKKRKEAEEIAGKIEYIELTIEPDFEKEFVNAMHIPHMRDS